MNNKFSSHIFVICIAYFFFSYINIISNQNKILENQEQILYILDGYEEGSDSKYNYVDIASISSIYYNKSKSKSELIKDVDKEIDYLNININKEIKKTKDKIEKIIKEN